MKKYIIIYLVRMILSKVQNVINQSNEIMNNVSNESINEVGELYFSNITNFKIILEQRI